MNFKFRFSNCFSYEDLREDRYVLYDGTMIRLVYEPIFVALIPTNLVILTSLLTLGFVCHNVKKHCNKAYTSLQCFFMIFIQFLLLSAQSHLP